MAPVQKASATVKSTVNLHTLVPVDTNARAVVGVKVTQLLLASSCWRMQSTGQPEWVTVLVPAMGFIVRGVEEVGMLNV